MSTKFIIFLVLASIALLIIIFWDKIKSWFNSSSSQATPPNDVIVPPNTSVGYKYDTIQQKCFRVEGNSQSWVSKQECISRGLTN